jgi:hypothetical protein
LKITRFWRRSPVYKYAIEIFSGEDDDGYIAVVPELAGCSAFGETKRTGLAGDQDRDRSLAPGR